ncbi:MAG: hypoxanthine phosphoribosyltransferase [Peptoniphilaceae bacterium]|nr:hypoxanthine phosphoribosyltransferase [Peptoniphilaceae bacterium]MDD7433645.1 hypoxanthine phosphoribosyltransferase [Peptoniphilaceae bacterium]MDY3076110.1 hypoxanthine phosphoribosyltransferase [Peptoniphilaceae bacterium]MDY3986391.1 hypoxanthine phosphoribosyltransferase [Peptoniphilaceae bacterium]MDY5841726.1 hypoxanthine phosphoribosyltransferase [Peptoniphilaceae bacterium]
MSEKAINRYVDRVLFSEEDIAQRVQELGRQITEDYKDGKADLLLVCILKGASVFLADLMKRIDLDVEIDFMSVSSYGAHTVSSGDVRILKDLDHHFMGKDILIVEDIIDTGYTLTYLKKNLESRGARSVKVAAVLNKQSRRVTDIQGDYVGFEVPDEYVIGYGMDFNQKLRNLPYIGTLKPIYYKDK